MANLVFGMNQSLDGYVDHMAFAPSPTLFRHFIEEAHARAGSVYGLALSMSIGSTCAPPCLVTAGPVSPDPGRRSA